MRGADRRRPRAVRTASSAPVRRYGPSVCLQHPAPRPDRSSPPVPRSLRHQIGAARQLLRTCPGLSLYLGGGLATWLLSRALLGHELGRTAEGALLARALHLLAVLVVAVLFFRRTGQLAQAVADMHALHRLLAQHEAGAVPATIGQRALIRCLQVVLRHIPSEPALMRGRRRRGE